MEIRQGARRQFEASRRRSSPFARLRSFGPRSLLLSERGVRLNEVIDARRSTLSWLTATRRVRPRPNDVGDARVGFPRPRQPWPPQARGLTKIVLWPSPDGTRGRSPCSRQTEVNR